MDLSWVEISEKALTHNIQSFRQIIGKGVVLAPTVKANAYGHGIVQCGQIFEKSGADYLCVNALYEAEALRKAGVKIPILIIGYTPLLDLSAVTHLHDVDIVAYNIETVRKCQNTKMPNGSVGVRNSTESADQKFNIHLKIETGNNRQGIQLSDLPDFVKLIKKHPNIILKGASTHFANLEDRINRDYANFQLKQFNQAIHILENEGMAPHYKHCASTAATLIFPEAHFNFVRLGIGAYGMWPSEKTEIAAEKAGINISLKPALTWKTVVAQVKEIKKGSLVGYGCTHEMKKDGSIAVLPIGYYDGYVRNLSNKGYVLIRGKKAPVIGRICMNIMMCDVSDIPDVKLEDEVVLIGSQKDEKVSAEYIAALSQTINYEVTTRINERIPRIIKN